MFVVSSYEDGGGFIGTWISCVGLRVMPWTWHLIRTESCWLVPGTVTPEDFD